MPQFTSYVYEVQVHSGVNLPKMDTGGTIDPYVRIDFPNKSVRTHTIIQNPNPVWDTSADLLIGEASADWELTFSLWDEDKGTKDDHVQTFKVPRSALPLVRKKFDVTEHGAVDASITVSISCFAAPSCAANSLTGPNITHVESSEGQDWYAPVPGCEDFAVGIHYNPSGDSFIYVAQTAPENVLSRTARFVATGASAKSTPAESTLFTHFMVGGSSMLSVQDPKYMDVLRRIGGPKGLRVFSESRLEAPGSVPLEDLCIRVIKKRSLLDSSKMSDLVAEHNWSRATKNYDDAKTTVKGCVLDDENRLCYFPSGSYSFCASSDCEFSHAEIAGYVMKEDDADEYDSRLFLDLIHASANERIITEYAKPVPLAGGKVQVVQKAVIASPPSIMRYDQVYFVLYEEEETVDIPFMSILPLK